MIVDRDRLLVDLKRIVSKDEDRESSLRAAADRLRQSGGYRWVGLYDVNRQAGEVRNIVWSGACAPEFPTFPITMGLTGAAVAERRTINVGDVAGDPRCLTAFDSTKGHGSDWALSQLPSFQTDSLEVASMRRPVPPLPGIGRLFQQPVELARFWRAKRRR